MAARDGGTKADLVAGMVGVSSMFVSFGLPDSRAAAALTPPSRPGTCTVVDGSATSAAPPPADDAAEAENDSAADADADA